MTGKPTRREFLKAASAGAAGVGLLGAGGCSVSGLFSEGYLPSRGERPNVIVVILDSLRKDHVGAYGNTWIETPNLDALAKESLRFDQARPEAMPTIPARRAIHTGMRTWPYRTPAYGWEPIPDEQVALAEILKKEGYANALVTDTYVQFPMNFSRGFHEYRRIRGQESDPYRDPSLVNEEAVREKYLVFGKGEKALQYLANVQGRRNREEEWFAPQVFLNAIEVLEEASRGGRPFFLVADCFDPHEPWDPPEKYKRIYDPDGYEGKDPLADKYGQDDYLTDPQLSRIRTLYSAEVTMADHWLGNFLDKAEKLGVMDDTLLILVSDHGHALGEHGFTGKPYEALWPEMTDVPFFIRHPQGKAAGQSSGYFASTHDVAPTILGALGIEQPSPMDGQDLSVLLDGEAPEQERPHFTLGMGDHVWTRDENYVMFCRNDFAEPRLYDVRNDPEQRRNLAEEDPGRVKRMIEDYILPEAGGPLPS